MNVESPRSPLWVFSWIAAWLVGNVRSILTVLFLGFVLNLIPDSCEHFGYTYGLPRTISYNWQWLHYGNLAFNVAVWSGMAIWWCVWRQLRASKQNRYFQIRLVDIAFVTAIVSAMLAYWVDLQRETEHVEKMLALRGDKADWHRYQFISLNVPWFIDVKPPRTHADYLRPPVNYRVMSWVFSCPGDKKLTFAEKTMYIEYLTRLQYLQALTLDRDFGNKETLDLTPSMTARLKELPSLHFLTIQIKSDVREHLVQVAQIPNLRGVHLICDSLTDDDLVPLQTMPYLRHLEIEGAQEFHGDRLPQFRQLNSLRLTKVHWNEELFRRIGMMEPLTSLSLFEFSEDSKLTPKDWECFAKLQRLETLGLYNCKSVGRQTIDLLSSLPNLRNLSLGGSTATDELVQFLPKLSPQILLRIHSSNKLTREGQDQLRELFRNRSHTFDF